MIDDGRCAAEGCRRQTVDGFIDVSTPMVGFDSLNYSAKCFMLLMLGLFTIAVPGEMPLCCWCLGYLQYSSSRRSEMAMQYFICWLMIHILIKLIVVRLVVLLDIFSLYIPGSIAQHENNLLIKVVSRLQLLLTNLRLLFMWIIIITWCPLTKTLKRTSLVCTFDRGTEGSADSFRCTNNSITLMYCIDGKSMIEDAFILISILFNNNS